MSFADRIVNNRMKLNRELLPYEKQGAIEKEKDSGIPPNSLLNLIKINSTFIELVDSGYQWAGILSAVCLPISLFFIYLGVSTIPTDLSYTRDPWYWITLDVAGDLFMASLGLIPGLFVFAEYFKYTYYPIRFNRQNRMVYVFRINGSVMEAPWDEIHFYRTPNSGLHDAAYLGGCWMEKDGKTVREQFQFGTQCEQDEGALAQWEFIRHYMEHGPKDLIDDVQVCMPIVGKKESYLAGLERISAHFGGWLRIVMFPFSFYVSLWRWLSTRTHKVPVWPKEVEDACAIDPNDPYVKDSRINPKHLQ